MDFDAIDVSRYQGNINWGMVSSHGVKHAYIKMGGADWVFPYGDPLFWFNVRSARENGIKVGYYWFFSGRHSTDVQFRRIEEVLSPVGQPDLEFVIDIEDVSRMPAQEIDDGLALAEMVSSRLGYRVMIS